MGLSPILCPTWSMSRTGTPVPRLQDRGCNPSPPSPPQRSRFLAPLARRTSRIALGLCGKLVTAQVMGKLPLRPHAMPLETITVAQSMQAPEQMYTGQQLVGSRKRQATFLEVHIVPSASDEDTNTQILAVPTLLRREPKIGLQRPVTTSQECLHPMRCWRLLYMQRNASRLN